MTVEIVLLPDDRPGFLLFLFLFLFCFGIDLL